MDVYSKDTLPLTIASPKFNRIAYQEARFVSEKLKLKKGDTILDVPCGTGRHARFFATSGLKVTAIDINPTCLSWAREYTNGLPIQYLRGNMGDLKRFRGKFDALANLFTSFGYFETEEENAAVMKEFYSALKPGGRIALCLINKDWLLKVFKPVVETRLGKETIVEAREYDAKTSTVSAHWFHLSANRRKARVYYNRLRIYGKSDLVSLMKQVGFKKIEVFGNYQNERFSRFQSTHPIYVGWKE